MYTMCAHECCKMVSALSCISLEIFLVSVFLYLFYGAAHLSELRHNSRMAPSCGRQLSIQGCCGPVEVAEISQLIHFSCGLKKIIIKAFSERPAVAEQFVLGYDQNGHA